MLNERIVIGKIEVVEGDFVQVRTDTIVEKDGVEIARTYHRRVLSPGVDLTEEDARVRAVAEAVWTLRKPS